MTRHAEVGKPGFTLTEKGLSVQVLRSVADHPEIRVAPDRRNSESESSQFVRGIIRVWELRSDRMGFEWSGGQVMNLHFRPQDQGQTSFVGVEPILH